MTITLEGKTYKEAMNERAHLINQWHSVPPIFTTNEQGDQDKVVVVSIENFLKKKRNGDFISVIDDEWILVGVSKYIY